METATPIQSQPLPTNQNGFGMPQPKEIVKPELQTLMLAEEVIIKQRRPGCAECENYLYHTLIHE